MTVSPEPLGTSYAASFLDLSCHIEPPVSIKAETLLNSKNFFPVAGVQLAALETRELFLLDFFPVLLGSFHA